MLDKWYSSQQIRQMLQISSQCLYQMRINGRIESKKISPRKYAFKLPYGFEINDNAKIAIYARVSTSKQKKDLDNQIKYLKQFVVSNGQCIDNDFIFFDIASGMNENRNGLNALMTQVIDGNVSSVVISNRDRLTRFGFGYLKSLFERFNCEVIEVNLTEEKTFEQELTDDLIAIIHHFSMKFYGKRKNKLKKFEKDIKNDSESCK